MNYFNRDDLPGWPVVSDEVFLRDIEPRFDYVRDAWSDVILYFEKSDKKRWEPFAYITLDKRVHVHPDLLKTIQV